MALIVEDDVAPVDETSNDNGYEYACVECGTELIYRGKGRKPVRCTPLNGGSDTCYKVGVTRGPRKGSSPTVDQLVEKIQGLQRMIGSGLAMHPKLMSDGSVLITSADMCGESWRQLLESDRKVRDMWTKFFAVTGWGTVVGTYLMMVGLPIAQNHHLPFVGQRPMEPTPIPTEQATPTAGFQAPNTFDEMGES